MADTELIDHTGRTVFRGTQKPPGGGGAQAVKSHTVTYTDPVAMPTAFAGAFGVAIPDVVPAGALLWGIGWTPVTAFDDTGAPIANIFMGQVSPWSAIGSFLNTGFLLSVGPTSASPGGAQGFGREPDEGFSGLPALSDGSPIIVIMNNSGTWNGDGNAGEIVFYFDVRTVTPLP